MPVFYVHDVRQGIVTPLTRQFKVHSIPATSGITKHKAVQERPNSGGDDSEAHQQAARYYQQSLNDSFAGLGYVKDIMTSPVLTIKNTAPLSDAWFMMQQHEIHHVVIIDAKNTYCGMLSEKTILPYTMAHPDRHPDDIPLSIFCQKSMLSTHPDTLISDLARALLEYGLDSIAVTDNDGGHERLVGVVTYSDILKIILKSKALGIQA